MKKEKHPVYRLVLFALILVLALGVALLVMGPRLWESQAFLLPGGAL